MSSAQKKLRRKKKKESEKDLKEKMGLFNMIPDQCTNCDKPFDKKDEDQVKSWRVAVREREKVVNLYCTECWDGANQMLKDLQERLEDPDV